MLNPLYLFGFLALILFSIPLAIFAALTTTIAVTTLTIRVSIVYIELGVALVHSWIIGEKSAKAQSSPRSSPSSTRHPRSSRRSSSGSASSFIEPPSSLKTASNRNSFSSLVSAGGEDRDFEGLGGWRVPGDTQEEALWIGMNSRLELPAVIVGERAPRRHQRSLTAGSQRWSWSPEAIRMSPVHSRSRTPTDAVAGSEGYFTLQPYGRANASGDVVGKTGNDGRRKSSSGSSTSSNNSRRPSAIAVK